MSLIGPDHMDWNFLLDAKVKVWVGVWGVPIIAIAIL